MSDAKINGTWFTALGPAAELKFSVTDADGHEAVRSQIEKFLPRLFAVLTRPRQRGGIVSGQTCTSRRDDGSLVFEAIRSSCRFSASIELNPDDSAWAFVSKSGVHASGSMTSFEEGVRLYLETDA